MSIVEKSQLERVFFKLFKLFINIDFFQRISNEYLYDLKVLKNILIKNEFDFIYFADIDFLPVVTRYSKNAISIFDAREFYPLQFENYFYFRVFEKIEYTRMLNKYLKKCNKVYTVSKGLADAYRFKFNINISVLFSCPSFKDISVKEIKDSSIKFLYHGMANRNRKIENYFELLNLVKFDCELHLYLVGDKDYIFDLKKYCIGNKKVYFHEPVHLNEIVDMAHNYDIGLCYFEPITFNLKYCLPNKFFEYIQARIIVASGPSPDMSNLLNQYDCGIVSDNFSIISLANSINSFTIDELNAKKRNSHIAAINLCFENQIHILSNDLLSN